MKRLTIAIVVLLLAAAAGAQETSDNAPATREDIQKYLDVMHSHDMMAQMMNAMTPSLHKMVHDQYLKDKDKLPADFEERTNKMMDDMFHNMPFDDMMAAMVPVYQRHLTKGDVKSLLVFYSSPTGQKMLHDLPAIMSESMEAMMPIMQKYMESVRQRINDEFAEALKQSGKKSD
ncbi:MAG TPA: DUF2059 domain-containing protein [Terriglobales bacterium]